MRKRIGEFFVEKGLLTEEQVEIVLKYGQRTGLRFGEAAIELALLSREKLIQVFGPSFAVDFFHLNSEFFPQATRDLLEPDDILRLGVLPLGFKMENTLFGSKKVLNLGFLNPENRRSIEEVERMARQKLGDEAFTGVKVFLILPDQLLTTLEKVYQVSRTDIREKDIEQFDSTLQLFFGDVASPAQ